MGQNMLRCDPAKRLTLSQIVNHSWVRGSKTKAVPSQVEAGFDRKWFMKNSSLDDMNGSTSSLLAELVESYSGLSTAESMASTAVTSEAESQTTSAGDPKCHEDSSCGDPA